MVKKIATTLVVGVFVFGINKLVFSMECGDMNNDHAQVQSGTTQKTVAASLAASQEAVNVGNKICPVTGEKIDEKAKATIEYQGKVYNLCCSMCIDEFKKDPEKYIKKVNEELQNKQEKKI